jgi:phosphatidylglycerol---prolipoprotein diacylglyceryl transferase
MIPTLLHIYGPLFIHSYGVCITIGLLLFICMTFYHPNRTALINDDRYVSLLGLGIFSALAGGRILCMLTYGEKIESYIALLQWWNGGFSVIGSIIAVIVTTSLYLKKHHIAVLPLMDLLAAHAPLLQACGRIGCFLAGCCYGTITRSVFGFVYTNPEVIAPCNIPLHPIQLYSAFLLMLIFVFLKKMISNQQYSSGTILFWYILLVSIERFCIDFLRGDRAFIGHSYASVLSVNQWITVILMIGSITWLIFSYHTKDYESI